MVDIIDISNFRNVGGKIIIVSQDKDIIVNFDNVESIDIIASLDGTGEFPYEINYETGSKREELGYYKTEERAKEVLQEIIELYKNQVNKYHYTNVLSVYEMPLE